MSPQLKTSHRFDDLIKGLAIQGYTQAHQVDDADLAPIARAWLIEHVDLADHDDQKTRTLPLIWTRSVCAQVMEWSEFQQACNEALARFSSMELFDLSADLLERLLRTRAKRKATVVPINRWVDRSQMPGGPAA